MREGEIQEIMLQEGERGGRRGRAIKHVSMYENKHVKHDIISLLLSPFSKIQRKPDRLGGTKKWESRGGGCTCQLL